MGKNWGSTSECIGPCDSIQCTLTVEDLLDDIDRLTESTSLLVCLFNSVFVASGMAHVGQGCGAESQ